MLKIVEKRNRMTARIPEEMRIVLEKAVELTGATLNQFVVQSAYQEARRILHLAPAIYLTRKDARRILELLKKQTSATN